LIGFAHGPGLLSTQALYLALPADERKRTSATPRAPFRHHSVAGFAFGFCRADRFFRRMEKEAGAGIALLDCEFVDSLQFVLRG
jgi:hypothetical protein